MIFWYKIRESFNFNKICTSNRVKCAESEYQLQTWLFEFKGRETAGDYHLPTSSPTTRIVAQHITPHRTNNSISLVKAIECASDCECCWKVSRARNKSVKWKLVFKKWFSLKKSVGSFFLTMADRSCERFLSGRTDGKRSGHARHTGHPFADRWRLMQIFFLKLKKKNIQFK